MFRRIRRAPAIALTAAFAVAIGAGFSFERYAAAAAAWLGRSAVAVRELAAPDPLALFKKDDLRVLVVGLDYDYDAKDMETSLHSRSDIIMAVNFDLVHRRIAELSIPRDMVATMPSGARAKINEAQSEGGIAESERVVAQWLGIPGFDRYVVLRIDMTKDLIDAVGGIDVDVENSAALTHSGPNGRIDYDDAWGHLHVHLKPGMQHLSGDQAVGYARFRHDWCSDPCRIRRQQQVIRALVERLERDRLNTVTHATALLGTVSKDIQTDLTPSEEIALAMSFAHVSQGQIQTAQVPYTGSIDLPGYGDSIVADEARKRELVDAMLLHEDAPVVTDAGRGARTR